MWPREEARPSEEVRPREDVRPYAETPHEVVYEIGAAFSEASTPRTRLTLTSLTTGRHKIPVVLFRGIKPARYHNNSIYIHGSNVTSPQELNRMIEVNRAFLKTLGPKLLDDPALRDARFITTAKSGADEYVTVYEVRGGKFGAIALKLNAAAAYCKTPGCTTTDVFNAAVWPWLLPVAGRGRLYMVGDDLQRIDPTELARRFDFDVIRRNDRIRKSLQFAEARQVALQDRRLESARTVLVNGLPRNEAEAVRSGYQRSEAKGLQNAGREIDRLAKQFFNGQSPPPFLPDELRELFLSGESDVVLIVAHSDKERIYINGTPVSVDEIKNYPARTTPSTCPRVCILLSCHAGDFGIEKGQ